MDDSRRGVDLSSRFMLGLPLALALAGCAGGVPSPEPSAVPRVSEADRNSAWIGRTEQEVVTVYGEPSRRVPMADGGAILYYRTLAPAGDSPQPTPDVRLSYMAKFWFGGNGKAYRVWIDPEAAAAHYRPPPE
jgi:hypothetical protein